MKPCLCLHLGAFALLAALASCGGGSGPAAIPPIAGKDPANSVSTPTASGVPPAAAVQVTLPPENASPPAPPTRGDPLPPDGPLPKSGNRLKGAWSSVVDWPLIAIHAALLPDGRVMTYGTQISRRGDGQFLYDIYDPSQPFGTPDAHLTLPNTTSTFLFFSAQVLLPLSGELLLSGGDIFKTAAC